MILVILRRKFPKMVTHTDGANQKNNEDGRQQFFTDTGNDVITAGTLVNEISCVRIEVGNVEGAVVGADDIFPGRLRVPVAATMSRHRRNTKKQKQEQKMRKQFVPKITSPVQYFHRPQSRLRPWYSQTVKHTRVSKLSMR